MFSVYSAGFAPTAFPTDKILPELSSTIALLPDSIVLLVTATLAQQTRVMSIEYKPDSARVWFVYVY
jgi:hypothetical protein